MALWDVAARILTQLASSSIGLVIKRFSSGATGDLQQWQNESGTALASVNSAGTVNAGNSMVVIQKDLNTIGLLVKRATSSVNSDLIAVQDETSAYLTGIRPDGSMYVNGYTSWTQFPGLGRCEWVLNGMDAGAELRIWNGNAGYFHWRSYTDRMELASIIVGAAGSINRYNGLSDLKFAGRRTSPGPPTASAWAANDFYVDSLGVGWLCTAGGTPGTWVSAGSSVIDVRNFGAKCDNSTDDTAAVQAAFNSIGDNTNFRGGVVFIPGICVISDTILIERKAVQIYGRNWGAQSAGNPGYGSGFRWAGTVNTKPMIQFRQCIGTIVQNLHFIGNTITANTPTAAISFYRAASGESQPNTMNRVEHCWFGQLLGYETAGIYLTNGILFEGTNQNNDQSWFVDNVFYSCATGVSMTGTQNVLNHFQECRWQNCGTGISTVATTQLDNSYFYGSTVRDIDISGGSFQCNGVSSEGSKQLARLRGTVKLKIVGEYFQITNNLSSDGRVIDAVDNYRQYLDIAHFDLRTSGYTNSAVPVIAIHGVTAGSIIHKTLGLTDLTYNSSAFVIANLDVAVAGTVDEVTVFGSQQGPIDASGYGQQSRFWNSLKSGAATPSFTRDDRIGWLLAGLWKAGSAVASSGFITIPAYDELCIVIRVFGLSGSDLPALQFNSDTAANYWSRFITSAAGGATLVNTQTASATMARLSGNNGTPARSITTTIMNRLGTGKVGAVNGALASGAAATIPAVDVSGQFEWVNTAAQITSVNLLTTVGASMAAESGMLIFGRNLV